MKDLVQLNKRAGKITGEFYRKIALPIVQKYKAKCDLDILLSDNTKLSGKIEEILEDEDSLSPDAYVILRFKFKTSSSKKIIDLFEVNKVL